MKKLTKEEASRIKAKPNGRTNYAKGVLLSMEVGDIILLEPEDWTRKTQPPSTYCLMLGRKMAMEWACKTALDGSGWVIERVK